MFIDITPPDVYKDNNFSGSWRCLKSIGLKSIGLIISSMVKKISNVRRFLKSDALKW